jgi:general secretion pathway protein M
MIAAGWHALATNERRMLAGGALVAQLLLAWAILWHPLALWRAELRADVDRLALADASAREAGLEGALRRVEPVGERNVRVGFEAANFDQLAQWLERLGSRYGVEAIELSAERAEGIGLVDARVTLRDVP